MVPPKDTQTKAKQEKLQFPFTKISKENVCVDKKLLPQRSFEIPIQSDQSVNFQSQALSPGLVHQNSQVAIFLAHPSTFALTVSRQGDKSSLGKQQTDSNIQTKVKSSKPCIDDDELDETPSSLSDTSDEEECTTEEEKVKPAQVIIPVDDKQPIDDKKPEIPKEKLKKVDEADDDLKKKEAEADAERSSEKTTEYGYHLDDDKIPEYCRKIRHLGELDSSSPYYLTESDDLDVYTEEPLYYYLPDYERMHPRYYRERIRDIPDVAEIPSSEEPLDFFPDYDRVHPWSLRYTGRTPRQYRDAEWISDAYPQISDDVERSWSMESTDSLLEDYDMCSRYAQRGDRRSRYPPVIEDYDVKGMAGLKEIEKRRSRTEQDHLYSSPGKFQDREKFRAEKPLEGLDEHGVEARVKELDTESGGPSYRKLMDERRLAQVRDLNELDKQPGRGERDSETHSSRIRRLKAYKSEPSLYKWSKKQPMHSKEIGQRRGRKDDKRYPSMPGISKKCRSDTDLEYTNDVYRMGPAYTREMERRLKRRGLESKRPVAGKTGSRERQRDGADLHDFDERDRLQRRLRQRNRQKQRRQRVLDYLGVRGRSASSRQERETKRRPTKRYKKGKKVPKRTSSRGKQTSEVDIDYGDGRYQIFPEYMRDMGRDLKRHDTRRKRLMTRTGRIYPQYSRPMKSRQRERDFIKGRIPGTIGWRGETRSDTDLEYLSERERPRRISDLDYLDDEGGMVPRYSTEMETRLRLLHLEGKRFPTRVSAPERHGGHETRRSDTHLHYLDGGSVEAIHKPSPVVRGAEKERVGMHLDVLTGNDLTVVRSNIKLSHLEDWDRAGQSDKMYLDRRVRELEAQEGIYPSATPENEPRRRPEVKDSRHPNEIQGAVRTPVSIEDTHYPTITAGADVRKRIEKDGNRYTTMVIGTEPRGRVQVDGIHQDMVSAIEDNRYPGIGLRKDAYRRPNKVDSSLIYGSKTHNDNISLGLEDGRDIIHADAGRPHVEKQEIHATVSDDLWTRKDAAYFPEHDKIRPDSSLKAARRFKTHDIGDDSYPSVISGVDALSRRTGRPEAIRIETYMDFLSNHGRTQPSHFDEMERSHRHVKDEVGSCVSAEINMLMAQRLEDPVDTMYPKSPEKIVTRPREPALRSTRGVHQKTMDAVRNAGLEREEETSRKAAQVAEISKDISWTRERSSHRLAADSSMNFTKGTNTTLADDDDSRCPDMTKSFQWHWNKLTEYIDDKIHESNTSAWSVDKQMQSKIGDEALRVYLCALRSGDTYWGNRLLGLFGQLLSNARKTSTFLKLNLRDVIGILSNDYLDVPHERHVFYAVYSWLQYNPSERLQHANAVLRCVRFGLMTSEELVKCALCSSRLQKIIMNIPEYQEALLKGCVAKKVFHKMPATSEFKLVKPRIKNDPSIYYNASFNNPDKECPCHVNEKRSSAPHIS